MDNNLSSANQICQASPDQFGFSVYLNYNPLALFVVLIMK